jgi:hypothetical protein
MDVPTAVYMVVQVAVLKEGGVSKCGATGPVYCMLIRSLLLADKGDGKLIGVQHAL